MSNDMHDELDHGRRHFLGKAAIAIAAARLGLVDAWGAQEREPRQIAALRRATEWLNSPPLSAATLDGKVVLVQFGTYTCINWLRTLPYVRAWSHRYRQGLVVIGVHTPEFTFEKKLANVHRAVQQMKLDFPIAVDNEYAIWRAFDNRYWPALYFIDARGRPRAHHFGEGEYERSELRIRDLLADVGVAGGAEHAVPIAASGVELQADWRSLKSPEIYLGYGRTGNFSSSRGAVPDRRHRYDVPKHIGLNEWALAGEWTMAHEPTTLNKAPGRLLCRFHARDVHLVMGAPLDRPVRFRVSMDGQRPGAAHGLDVDDSGNGTVTEHRLYQLIRQPGSIVDRTLEIEFLDAGVEAFAFTFG